MAAAPIVNGPEPSEPKSTGRRTGRWLLAAAGVLLVIGAVAFAVFRPDKLFIDKRVDEQLPADVAAAVDPAKDELPETAPQATVPPGPGTPETVPPETVPPETVAPAQPEVLGRGTFVSQGGHTVNGTAVVVRSDGQRLLVLPDLDSQNGPSLELHLSPRSEGSVAGGVRLGPLKGNIGTQSYELPADVDLSVQRNVVIWCERFGVPFGTVTLAPG